MNGPDPSWIQLRKKSGKAEHQHDAEQLSRLFDTLYQLPIPILASVRGNANAAGVGLLCCCDLVVASDCSSYTISETKFGQVPALQSPYLVKALGERSARYYSLTGETMDATTAARVGLVSKVVAADEFEEIVESTVQRLLRRTNLILRQTKAMLNLSANEILDDSLVDTLVECSTDIRLSQNHDSRKVLP